MPLAPSLGTPTITRPMPTPDRHARRAVRLLAAMTLPVALLCAAPRAAAQSPAPPAPPPSTPTPGHERLAFFDGWWTVDGLPREREFREHCTWMEGGRRHIVCRSRSRSASGERREGYSLFSYRPSDSTYLYHGFRPSGAVETMTGKATRDGWEFETASGAGAARQRMRVTIARLVSGGFHLIDATATGDGAFVPGDTVRYVRLPAAP
jgi:hypothetical protein